MIRTAVTALGLVGCGEPAPVLPSPSLVEVAGGDPLRPWVQVIVGPDGIGVEPEPWLRQVPARTELPPPHRVWLGAEPDLSASRKDLLRWLYEADDAAQHGRNVPSALAGINVLVDAEAPGPLVLEGLMLAASTVMTVQIAGRVGDRPRGVLGSAAGTCVPAVAVVLAEDGAAVVAGPWRLGPEGCWLEGDEATAAAAVVETFLAACRPRWAEVALAAGRPADDLDCAYATAVWDPDHTDGARLVSVLGALYAVDPRLTVGLPQVVGSGATACAEPARPIASLTDEELDEVCQVEEVRMRVAREDRARWRPSSRPGGKVIVWGLLFGLAWADVASPEPPRRMSAGERAAAIAAEDAALIPPEATSPWAAVATVGGGVVLLGAAGLLARSRRQPG